MPGREYVASIRDFWRVCSGINDEAKKRVKLFLSSILNVEKFPLTVLDRPIESETCKIVENSYRATILAFLDEWSRFSERNGVDLIKVVKAIKVRPTHSNMIFPGPGVGGYCLPKDGGLGVWAYHTLMGFEDDIFKITPLAIDINDTRALHVAQLVRVPCGIWDGSSRPPKLRCWGPLTVKTWVTPVIADRRSSSANLRKWVLKWWSTIRT